MREWQGLYPLRENAHQFHLTFIEVYRTTQGILRMSSKNCVLYSLLVKTVEIVSMRLIISIGTIIPVHYASVESVVESMIELVNQVLVSMEVFFHPLTPSLH